MTQTLIRVAWWHPAYPSAGELLTRDPEEARAKAAAMRLAGWLVETREAFSGRPIES